MTTSAILDAIEARYPMSARDNSDHVTKQRRPFLRFFACEEDLSLESPEAPLPDAIASGKEPFFIIGAIAGGKKGPRSAVFVGKNRGDTARACISLKAIEETSWRPQNEAS